MNAAKTQLLLSTQAGNVSKVTVEVDGNTILHGNVIKLLGVRYERKLTTTPLVKSLLAALRQQASVVARLANHLPWGRGVPSAAVLRACHGQVCSCTGGCGKAEAGARGQCVRHLEVFNDVARSISGARRRDHITIKDLLDLAGIESANRIVVKAIVAKTWSCYHSDDGKDGARNDVGTILFSDNKTATAKTTHSARTGQITVPLRGGDTFVTHVASVWNRSVMLGVAPTKAAAKKAASDLAGLSPL
jgi:hypothetical protein